MFPEQHLFRIEVPERVAIEGVEPAALPRGWVRMAAPLDRLAPPTPLQKLGDAWWETRRAVAWVVPSALVPEEPNVLLNPGHPDFDALRVEYARPFRYDPRLGAKR
ncbi:MAG: RES domain-containing protein [Thermoanaerobaculia bacterium]|nr:MAG: RES domain-containing protein [Thermoanaerobaculia bacterium]